MPQILALAWPVILSYVGQMAMQWADLWAVGKLGPASIGALGIGSACFMWVAMFGIGLLSGLDFLIAHAFGAGRLGECAAWRRAGLKFATLAALPCTAILFGVAELIPRWATDPEVARAAVAYLRILALSLWPMLIFQVDRQYLQALGRPRPAMWLMVGANVLNVILNYAWVLGHWGLPAWGAAGAALSTLVARVLMAALLAYSISRHPRREVAAGAVSSRELMRLGWPAALQMLFEVGVFAVATLLAGKLEAVALAAHQITLNLASGTFMIPLGISSAAAVLVGQAVGRDDVVEARRVGWRALGLGVGYMGLSALGCAVFARPLLGIFTDDPAVLLTGVGLMFWVALFQLADGAQVVATGALRGMGDTRSAAIANFFGHWMLGLPLGAGLAFGYHWGVRGLWIGLSAGLVAVALGVVGAWTYRGRILAQKRVIRGA